MADHQHHWALASADKAGEGKRMIRITCTGCDEVIVKLTARTDEELAAEIEAANGTVT